jgi:hypothetical protein
MCLPEADEDIRSWTFLKPWVKSSAVNVVSISEPSDACGRCRCAKKSWTDCMGSFIREAKSKFPSRIESVICSGSSNGGRMAPIGPLTHGVFCACPNCLYCCSMSAAEMLAGLVRIFVPVMLPVVSYSCISSLFRPVGTSCLTNRFRVR